MGSFALWVLGYCLLFGLSMLRVWFLYRDPQRVAEAIERRELRGKS